MSHLLQTKRFGEGLARLRSHWAAMLRYAAARREFARLEPADLRDLGIGSSEFGSYWAEARGRAERTRMRILGTEGAQR